MVEAVFDHVRITVFDGMGAGEATSRQSRYPQDEGVNSLVNASRVKALHAPNLLSMGLHQIPGLEGMEIVSNGDIYVRGAYGALTPTFAGNGSPEGHQALMGHIVTDPYLLFDETGFPPEIVNLVTDTATAVLGRETAVVRYPGTDDINGVKFINHPGIGDAHLKSRDNPENPLLIPIYASTDSVLQIALHQEVVPQEQIEELGQAIRQTLDEQGIRIARVIMRPFVGGPEPGTFKRVSADRRDYGVDPDEPTLINHLTQAGIPVYGIGKAPSMLNYSGFDPENVQKLGTDEERMQTIITAIKGYEVGSKSLGFDNLIGTDELFGHTRQPVGYIDHIEMLDSYVGQGMEAMPDNALWIITSDHGNDPTQLRHPNHTNERTPVLVYHRGMKRPIPLGIRASFADVAKTVAHNFGIADQLTHGESFLGKIIYQHP